MKYLLSLVFCIISYQVMAQITTSSNWDNDKKEYKIIAESDYTGYRVVKLNFDYINGNCRDGNNGFEKTIGPGRSTLTTVSPLSGMTQERPKFKYKTVSYLGRTDKEPQLDYPYLIPIKNGQTTEIKKQPYLGQEFGIYDPPKNFYSLYMKTTSGDTIYAARQGTVVEVIDNNISASEQNMSFTINKNSVEIQHKDGTTASYKNFLNGGIFLKKGDKVYAGQAIGTIGGENYEVGSHLSFSVFYYDYYPKISDGRETKEYYSYAYVPISFYSLNGVLEFEHCDTVIESVHDDSIISYEMSKREKKKWNKIKKSK